MVVVPFHGPAQYADQNLTKAIHILATGPGDVRSRLAAAHNEFWVLSETHFPEHLREDFRWIQSQLTKFDAYVGSDGKIKRTSVEETLRRIKNSTGTKIAERLLILHYKIGSYVNLP